MSDELLEKYKTLMEKLAKDTVCPGCGDVISPPFFNLGASYSWAEGCERCYETT